MNALSIALLAFALAVNSQKLEQPPPDIKSEVSVEIVVGEKGALEKMCLDGAAANTVFVVSANQVYHCLGKKLHDHSEHIKNSSTMDPSIVRAYTGQHIRWFSKTTEFSVVSVVKDPKGQPQDPLAPTMPFTAFPKQAAREVRSSPVPDLRGTVNQRYKVTFHIQGIGQVDPDVVCSM